MARHRCDIALRWNDFDVLHHVNNVRYIEFMQEARVSILSTAGADASDLTGIGHYVVHQEVDYLRPIGMSSQSVGVEVRVTKIAGAGYTLAYDMFDDQGTLCARGATAMGCVDTATQTVTRMPLSVRSALEPFVEV